MPSHKSLHDTSQGNDPEIAAQIQAKKQLLNDIRDATILQITPSVVLQSVKLLEANTLRAMDALHVACALAWQADLFITSDKKQFEAAVNTGISSELIGQQVH